MGQGVFAEVGYMIRGLIFDINGTTSDILTNEYHDEIYRVLANFLDYQGIALRPDELREMYSAINKRQRKNSGGVSGIRRGGGFQGNYRSARFQLYQAPASE